MKTLLSQGRIRLAVSIETGLPRPSRHLFNSACALCGSVALGLALGGPGSAQAATYVVDTAGDPGAGGTLSLRQAVFQANASPNNVVQFAPGLNGSTITLLNGEIAVSANMYISGPGAAQLTVSGNHSSRIYKISNPGAGAMSVTVSGLSLANAQATTNGAAMLVQNAALDLRHSVISGNATSASGAGLYASGALAALKLTDVVIQNNTAVVAGGGIMIKSDAAQTILDSVISGNSASACGGAYVSLGTGFVTVRRTRISGNSAAQNGGGLCSRNLGLYDSVVSGNSSGQRGGGMYARGRTPIVTTLIANNSATFGGGGMLVNCTDPVSLFKSTVSGNTAGNNPISYGGGIDVRGASFLYIGESLISGNTAASQYTVGGGGIALEKPVVSEIFNSTIAYNYAVNDGGGVSVVDTYAANHLAMGAVTIVGNGTGGYATDNGIYVQSGTPTLRGCIIANNTSRAGQGDLHGTFNATSCLIKTRAGATVTGTGNITNGVDPLLGPLTVNGGPTLTMMPAIGSPVLDTGDPTINGGSDQRGLPRVANGHSDMGAVERQSPEDVIFRNGFNSS